MYEGGVEEVCASAGAHDEGAMADFLLFFGKGLEEHPAVTEKYARRTISKPTCFLQPMNKHKITKHTPLLQHHTSARIVPTIGYVTGVGTTVLQLPINSTDGGERAHRCTSHTIRHTHHQPAGNPNNRTRRRGFNHGYALAC